jgi:hypothetical protein
MAKGELAKGELAGVHPPPLALARAGGAIYHDKEKKI